MLNDQKKHTDDVYISSWTQGFLFSLEVKILWCHKVSLALILVMKWESVLN